MPGSGSHPRGSAVTRNTLRQQIAEALRDEVLAGRLPAGQHIAVKEIAEQYGVSATPVREALVDLSAQGLVDLEHHRGFQVHRFTPQDFRDMVEARTLIVDGIFRHAVQRILDALTPAAVRSLRRRADEAVRASRAGDLDVLIGHDLRFWRELGQLVGNPYIRDMLDRVRVQSWVFAVPYLRREADLAGRLWSGHGDLADAVAARDEQAARLIITGYNDHSLELLDRFTARYGPS
ncbi:MULTISPECIES: GntR family transcriptional regulator [Streptomyces]|uniref:GntR family transcriptional regulator n=2 Tax=Streptomyces TaxID=1883 RepID=A0A3R7IL10_9ACTN|nr:MULTISPECIES: GntR family transcriptional regulator [Streptomyces]KNE82977.1 GntR family transcriptional regulator [Streptomyces fradiae]OFA52932.1 GntR family transcriptional regulator [Streptomyces fradiae]PQM20388.1 GntR family transcriptional regulator [Streptomyces xinghaiensis]RKM91198.1 GntR family transcriptional regulator [Streptomyces xinghaiensis]RNC69691.1 GntR family transcriptional regulator [Streptomyces xinghaiensis]